MLKAKICSSNFSSILKQSNISQEVCDKYSRQKILTVEGRTPPSAEYKESFPTGIPIPW